MSVGVIFIFWLDVAFLVLVAVVAVFASLGSVIEVRSVTEVPDCTIL
jgi:hypothetical protein